MDIKTVRSLSGKIDTSETVITDRSARTRCDKSPNFYQNHVEHEIRARLGSGITRIRCQPWHQHAMAWHGMAWYRTANSTVSSTLPSPATSAKWNRPARFRQLQGTVRPPRHPGQQRRDLPDVLQRPGRSILNVASINGNSPEIFQGISAQPGLCL